MASSRLMVDKPPFVDLHSLLNRVTLSFLEEVDTELLSWPSCDVEAVLGRDDISWKKGSKFYKGLYTCTCYNGFLLAVSSWKLQLREPLFKEKGHFFWVPKTGFTHLFRGHFGNQNVTDYKEAWFFKCILITSMEAFTNRTTSLKLM